MLSFELLLFPMVRKKQYSEDEVIEKAMHTFWENGYESTSVRMLEQEMGINQFSIYSSFGSKKGVFLESLKAYGENFQRLIDKLKNSENAIEGIKGLFYDLLEFTEKNNEYKGCLVTNTIDEMGNEGDEEIKSKLHQFVENSRKIFITLLKKDGELEPEKKANYLISCILGLSVSSKVLKKSQLEDYIESIFAIF